MNDLLVTLQIAGSRAALRAVDVRSVVELDTVHPVPRTPPHILGLAAMRSQSMTVIDARAAVGLSVEAADTDADTDGSIYGERSAIVEHSGHLYALRVEAIDDVTMALSEPTAITGGLGEHWQHVSEGMVETASGPAILIDLAALIKGPPAVAS
ncbi:MAG: chemotaxis protein CheW [Pontixanthobacter sp.]